MTRLTCHYTTINVEKSTVHYTTINVENKKSCLTFDGSLYFVAGASNLRYCNADVANGAVFSWFVMSLCEFYSQNLYCGLEYGIFAT